MREEMVVDQARERSRAARTWWRGGGTGCKSSRVQKGSDEADGTEEPFLGSMSQ